MPICLSSRAKRLLLIGLFFGATAASGAPFRPTSDDQMLERLPTRLVSAEQQTLRKLRAELNIRPRDAAVAADLAERYSRQAQRSGDPRYIGYAQSVLLPWPAGSDAPSPIRTVRALIAQFLHDFDSALQDLDAVITANPADIGARAYRAIIYLVKADYAPARADCLALESRIKGLVAGACVPTVDAVTGQAERSLAVLEGLLDTYPAAPINERLWVLNRLAEINQRLGRWPAADTHYQRALALGLADQYLLATYAEFLLDQQRPKEVIDLLKNQTANDVLLLRLAMAEKRHGSPLAVEHQAMLADRYEASRRRGDKLHLADEAMFALHFSGDPAAALRYARENWDLMQREPSDARVLLEAALAAQSPAGGAPAVDWLRGSGNQDVIIRRLAGELDAMARGQK